MKTRMLLFLSATCLIGCSKQKESSAPTQESPVVFTVNYPLACFAERIADGRVEVVFPEMAGDPAFWEPTPEQIGFFQSADLIVLNGAAYAKWVPKVSLPQARLVDTSSAFSDQLIGLDDEVTHAHGPSGAHAHGDLAFTTWLDPLLAIEQAAAMDRVFSSRWSSDAAGFSRNFQALKADLSTLDTDLEQAFARVGQQPLLGSHPVYQYMARRYALDLKSVHWEPDAEPDESMLRELDGMLEVHPARWMLWEEDPLDSTKQLLKVRGIQCVVFNPCSNRPATGDYFSTMQTNLQNLKLASAPEL